MCVFLAMTVSFTVHSIAAKSEDSKILSCEGKMVLSVPSDASEAGKEAVRANNSSNEISQIYEINKNKLVETGGKSPSVIYTLCKKSESEYIYSSDCTINELQYLHDWNSKTDHKYPSSFLKKYVSQDYAVIYINRVNLQITRMSFSPTFTENSKHNGYMETSTTEMNCALRKPRI